MSEITLDLPEQAPDDQVLAPFEDTPTDPVDVTPDQLTALALAGEDEGQDLGDPTPDDPTDHVEPAPLGLLSVPQAVGTIAQLRARVQAWAETQVGVKETPRYSNIVRYWTDMYPAWMGSSWCGTFVSCGWARVGIDMRRVLGTGAYYCPAIEASAKATGAWHANGSGYDPKPADLILFGRAEATHVGYAAPRSGNYSGYRTIEGNTSSGNGGSQTNGDGVYERFRSGSFIRGWVDMDAWITAQVRAGKLRPATAKTMSIASVADPVARAVAGGQTPRPPISLTRTLAAITGPDKGRPSGNVRIVQGLLNDGGWTKRAGYEPIPVTGVWSERTQRAMAALQVSMGYHGADADGIPGAESFAKLVGEHWSAVA